MNKKIALVSMVLLVFGFTAMAAEFAAPEKHSDGNMTFSSGEMHKNLYTVGGNITVNSDITGDLFIAGGIITVTGKVEKDLMVAGGNINLNGPVGDDLRVTGGNISINSPIGGDLLAAGGSLTVTEKSTIGGDLVVGGGSVVIDSPVIGNVKIGGGSVTINSTIGGDVEVMADKALTFGPKSIVTGKIVYKGSMEAIVKDGAKITEIQFTRVQPENFGNKLAGFLTVLAILKFLALFAAAWVFNRLFPGKFPAVVNNAYTKPWHNLGIGAAVLFATPIAAVLLMTTVIGLYLGLALMLAYLLTLVVTTLALPYFVGATVVKWVKKSSMLEITWQALIYGLLIVAIVKWVPILGGIAVGIVYMMVLGAVAIYAYNHERQHHLPVQ